MATANPDHNAGAPHHQLTVRVSEVGHHSKVLAAEVNRACDAFFERRGLNQIDSWMNQATRDKAIKREAARAAGTAHCSLPTAH